MFSQTKTSYEFGPFLVDPRERQLIRNGEVVPLRPKVFDILLMLVENSGHILTKDDVMKHVWSNTAVEEGNISRTISTLRNALGEGPNEHRYIETIPWRGYRFVANVREIRTESVGRKIDSIAVLPFVNVDADEKTEYLADGITEGVITSLGQLTGLRVISRNSVFRYKGCEVDTRGVGSKLKVQTLLLGRVVRTDEMLSISVELIDADDDRHLWGAQYVRNPAALGGTYETIAQSIREKHKSITELHKVIEMEPNFVAARSVMGNALSRNGRHDEAMSEYRKALELIKGATTPEVSIKALMAHAYATSSKRSAALKLLDEVTRAEIALPYFIGGIYAALGDYDSAFHWLYKAYEQRDVQLVSLKVDPLLDPLRQDRRFAGLMNRVALPR